MKDQTAHPLLIILSLVIMIFLFIVNKENNKLNDSNKKYIHKIDSLTEIIHKQGEEIYIYETANAMFYEKHRDCGVKLNKMLLNVKR
jgi:preprotein translocase subunit YajC